MKKLISLVLLVLLAGCAFQDNVDKAIALRQQLLNSKGCKFDAEITADYSDKLYTFAMKCTADSNGNVDFCITSPETIAGIEGNINAENGQLRFDDQILVFDLLTEELITPISTPWLLLKTLRGGYIDAAGIDGDLYRVQIDDSYEDDPLRLDIWLNADNQPSCADVFHDGRRVVSIKLENFQLL